METFFLLHFLKGMLQRNTAKFGDKGPRLLEAASLLLELVDVMRAAPKVLSEVQVAGLLASYKKYMQLVSSFKISTPKAHLMFHLLRRSRWYGNPWYYHTFPDEGENRRLKRCLRLVHQSNFEAGGIAKFGELRRLSKKRRLG